MARSKFRNGRDSESQLSFVLNVGKYVGRYTNLFSTNDEVEVPINVDDEDRYVVFLPTPGASFIVSDTSPILNLPDVGNGGTMIEFSGVLNPAVINLVDSGFSNLFIKSIATDQFALTVLVYS